MRVLFVILAACSSTTRSSPPSPPAPQPAPEPVTPPVPGVDASACASKPAFGEIRLTADQAAKRRGQNIKTYGEISTSRSAPIELCGAQSESEWIRDASCADGTRPSKTERDANPSSGGTCNTIIDVFTIACPEKTYQVYFDIYMCGPGEDFMRRE